MPKPLVLLKLCNVNNNNYKEKYKEIQSVRVTKTRKIKGRKVVSDDSVPIDFIFHMLCSLL